MGTGSHGLQSWYKLLEITDSLLAALCSSPAARASHRPPYYDDGEWPCNEEHDGNVTGRSCQWISRIGRHLVSCWPRRHASQLINDFEDDGRSHRPCRVAPSAKHI